MKTVTLYTDGACSGNPGPGGWGAILEYMGHEKELSGGETNTTNNRMELTAVIRGLEALKEPCIVELYSDSKYVIDALEKGWAWGWKKRGWIKSDKKPALNPDLWEILLGLTQKHELHYHWVKGHAENPKNNRCDELAVNEWKKIKGLQALKEPCIVELYSDSKYVIDALEKGWAWGWKKKNWIKSDKKPALNPDLWEILLSLTMKHEVHYHWVKGHATNPKNNRCDELAVAEWKKLK